jgi:hypothetical protein
MALDQEYGEAVEGPPSRGRSGRTRKDVLVRTRLDDVPGEGRKDRRARDLASLHIARTEDDGIIRHQSTRMVVWARGRRRLTLGFGSRPAARVCYRLDTREVGGCHALRGAREKDPQHDDWECGREEPGSTDFARKH